MSTRFGRRPAALVASALMGAVILVGCGGGGGGGGGNAFVEPKGAATETIAVEAGNYYFKPNNITAKPGIAKIELHVVNNIHDFVFDGAYSGFLLEGSSGETQSKKIDLKAGKYTFYCSLPGHRAAGMEGTLTVK